MLRKLFPLLLLLATSLSAQKADYQLSATFGLSGLNGNALEQGAYTSASLDKVHKLNDKTNFWVGLGLQYSNYEVGAAEQPCDFPLGDKVVVFTFTETYEFNPLEGVLRLGLQRKLGKFTVSGMVLPTVRLHDRIASTHAINFSQLGRPNQFGLNKVRPGEQFTWSDFTTRELRYNTSFQLRGGLTLDFALSKQLAIGLGYQAGLTKYQLTNYLQDTRPGDEMTEFAVTEEDARTSQGYLLLRVKL
ncbi:MAG: hypothetical protein AAF597_20310 [Bacteroidota bacterium]